MAESLPDDQELPPASPSHVIIGAAIIATAVLIRRHRGKKAAKRWLKDIRMLLEHEQPVLGTRRTDEERAQIMESRRIARTWAQQAIPAIWRLVKLSK